jgi:hypothetical protein
MTRLYRAFFNLVGMGFELRALSLQSRSTIWATPPVHFALVILEMGVLQTICLDWPWTVILLISASQVARITGVSHWCPAWIELFVLLIALEAGIGQSTPLVAAKQQDKGVVLASRLRPGWCRCRIWAPSPAQQWGSLQVFTVVQVQILLLAPCLWSAT